MNLNRYFASVINKNTRVEYEPSTETKQLLKEVRRKLISEDFSWNKRIPYSLSTYCVISISKSFTKYPRLDDLVNCVDRDLLIEILRTDLPLLLVVPLIEEEIYWQRRYMDIYGITFQRRHEDWTWKCIFLEKYISELIEKADPQFCEENEMEEITNLVNPYIRRLTITQLQSWGPLKDENDILAKYPIHHINFNPIFRCLTNIEELQLSFSKKNIRKSFSMKMFKVSVDDCTRLGTALLYLKKLRTLKIHDSQIEDTHCQALMKGLIKNKTLEELDLSDCQIADKGALCIAKLMMNHTTLKRLILVNNKISKIGGEGFGYAMMQDCCCPINHLNLRLNPLGHDGIMGIFRCLVRVFKLEELIISGCGFNDETPLRLGQLLTLNKSLKVLDVSNNSIIDNGLAVLLGIMDNHTLEYLDLRQTDIDAKLLSRIRAKVNQNNNSHLNTVAFEYDVWEQADIDNEEEIAQRQSRQCLETTGSQRRKSYQRYSHAIESIAYSFSVQLSEIISGII